MVLFDDSHLGMTSTSSVAGSRQSPLEGSAVVFESVRDLNTLQRLVLSSQILSHIFTATWSVGIPLVRGHCTWFPRTALLKALGTLQDIVKAVGVDVEVN